MMIIKIDNTLVPLKKDETTGLFFVDLDGQATSGNTEEEVIQKLQDSGREVSKTPPTVD